MTIAGPSLEQVYAALRADYIPGEEPQAFDHVLEPLIEAALELCNRLAPNVPEAVGSQAVTQCVMWMAEYSTGDGQVFAAWQRSGAASLVKPWVIRRAGLIG